MHAVAEAARKVACTGATPVAATNCLNFGNPEKPEIMAQLSSAIDGIAEACTALGTPITGGNVSLYNETKGEGIYPTPVLGIVGIIEDVTKACRVDFSKGGERIIAALGQCDPGCWRALLRTVRIVRLCEDGSGMHSGAGRLGLRSQKRQSCTSASLRWLTSV